MPDATGLELIAQELGDQVIGTTYFRDKAALTVRPEAIRDVLEALRGKGFTFMASLHGVDYFPEEPRLGVQYELLDMSDRIRQMILERRPTGEIKQAAREEGMTFLRDSALEQVFAGRTTLREINKVTFVV